VFGSMSSEAGAEAPEAVASAIYMYV